MIKQPFRSATNSIISTVSALLFSLAIAFMFAGCSDDSTAPAGTSPADFSGNWDLTAEVIEKKTCGRDIGDQLNWEIPIVQDGSHAIMVIDNVIPIDLTVNGSHATGSTDDGSIVVDLTLTEGELGGTLSVTRTSPDCTEVYSLSGTRTNAAPSGDFAGNWDFGTLITSSTCENEPEGSTDEVCLTITVVGNTVSIDDGDGLIAGVGDGNTAVLRRFGADERLVVTIELGGRGISGEISSYDFEDECQVTGTVSGIRRTSPCPPPPTPGDFAGSWLVDIFSFSQSGCIGESEEDYFGPCMTVSVDGSEISVDDGSGRGPVTGSIEGNSAVLTRTEANGVYTLYLDLDGDDLFGEATMNYTSGECTGTVVEIFLGGTPVSEPCGSGTTGDFAGYWIMTGEFTSNPCGFSFSPTCSEFQQFGNTVVIVDEGLQGTVTGSTLTISQQDGPISVDFVVVLAAGGDTFTGTFALTLQDFENPEESCTSVVAVSGTRTTDCVPESAGFGITLPTGDGW